MMDSVGYTSRDKGYAGDSAGHFASQRVPRKTLAWIMVAQGIAILPLFYFLPAWLLAIWFAAVAIRIQIFRGVWPYPSNVIKLAFGLVGAVLLYWSYGRFGVEPMIGFMLVSFVLKLIEVRNRTDVLIVLYIAFVAIATQLLLSQSVWISLYSLFSCIVVFAALGVVFRHREVGLTRQIRASTAIVAKSVPLMLILFLVMPRMGQLWAVPSLTGSAKTGFSDEMTPGDFSRLVRSSELAFRVSFENQRLPPRSEWYWRGLVLERFDGKRWSRRGAEWLPVNAGAESAVRPHPHWQMEILDANNKWITANGVNHQQSYRYSILMEPHNQQWLFTLMAPVKIAASKEPKFVDPIAVVLTNPLTSRFQYTVESVHQYRINAENKSHIGAGGLSHNLLLPKSSNERAKKMAAEWLSSGKTPEQIISSALDMYRQSFTYTLRPPPLGKDAVDEFLFETQRGFCEHFASSFAVLMRAANIPARVVVGYLGGEYNKERNYISVRQSDAHAWVELWRSDLGWIRVDPTAAVSPERIERSLLDTVSAEEEALVGGALMRMGAFSWFAKLSYKMEEWDYLWQVSVLAYNDNMKQSFFNKVFGAADTWKIGLFFIISVAGFFVTQYLIMTLLRKRHRIAPEDVMMQRLFRHFESRGIFRFRHETVLKFCSRFGIDNPKYKTSMSHVARLYNLIAYADRVDLMPELNDEIRKMLRAF